MQRSRKRARTTPLVVQTSTKRPIDKSLINVTKTTIADSQYTTTLATATYPGTVTGLRWSIAVQSEGSGDNIIYWAIVRTKDGVAVSTIATSDASKMYVPEQEVLAFGIIPVQQSDATAGPCNHVIEGNTKSMRKLANGDQLVFIAKGTVGGDSTTLRAIIQFFTKT